MAAVLGRLISTLLPVALTYPTSTSPASAVAQSLAMRPAAGIERQVVPGALVVPARAHHPAVVPALQVPLLGLGEGGLVPRVALVHRVAQRVVGNEGLLVLPVLVVGGAEQDADAEVYVHQVRGHELAVDDDAGRNELARGPTRPCSRTCSRTTSGF